MFFNRGITRGSIKEAIDSLPIGICYFNERGIIVLCNDTMHTVSSKLLEHDLWYKEELDVALLGCEGNIFISDDNQVWKFSSKQNPDKTYEYVALDITELYNGNKQLMEENEQLKKMRNDVRTTNNNIVAIAREEEILSMKMDVHRDMGKRVLSLHKFYEDGCPKEDEQEFISQMRTSLQVLMGEVGVTDDADILNELMQAAETVGADIDIDGELPNEQEALGHIVAAMQECLINTIRHAKGDTVYVKCQETEAGFEARISNNGNPPKEHIVEGGGLSSLRHRIENAGGMMQIEDHYRFVMYVSIPKKGEART